MAAAAVVGALAVPAEASTFKPTRTDDPAPNGCKAGDCSLREAFRDADEKPGDDTVLLDGGHRYELRRGVLTSDKSMTVRSDGGSATIDGNGDSRIFNVAHPSEPGLTLSGLTLVGGKFKESGGAVLASTLIVTNSKLRGNVSTDGAGGAIRANFLNMTKSVIEDNEARFGGGGAFVERGTSIKFSRIVGNRSREDGGGIYMSDAVNGSGARIEHSTIAQNRARAWGGGVLNANSQAQITDSTISGNTSGRGGGGVANVTYKPHPGAGLAIVTSTIAKNKANGFGGGVDSFIGVSPGDFPTTDISSSTIAFNKANADNTGGELGGGIQVSTDFHNLENSIVADNTVGAGGANPDCSGNVGSLGYNLIGDSTGCGGLVGTDIIQAPQLGKLGRYGGPTSTIKLKPGSPAVNNANDATCGNKDQRGRTRDDCDIGAFEL